MSTAITLTFYCLLLLLVVPGLRLERGPRRQAGEPFGSGRGAGLGCPSVPAARLGAVLGDAVAVLVHRPKLCMAAVLPAAAAFWNQWRAWA
jgi:hypothetical protein